MRGFTFNIDSGVVESLELDSFGLTIVPASLVILLDTYLLSYRPSKSFDSVSVCHSLFLQVSTYCLFVEDVLDIVSDTVVVHEDAISRVQRLTQVSITDCF